MTARPTVGSGRMNSGTERPLRGTVLLAGAVCCGFLLAAAVLLLLVRPRVLDSIAQAELKIEAEAAAQLADAQLLALSSAVERTAASAAARAAVRGAGSDEAAGLAASGFPAGLAAGMSFAEQVHLLPIAALPDTASVDGAISYAGVELIQMARDLEPGSTSVGPEVIRGRGLVLHLAAPIRDDGAVLGVVYVQVRPAFLGDVLSARSSEAGAFRVVQRLGPDAELPVALWGKGSTAHSEVGGQPAAIEIPLAAPNWFLVLDPALADVTQRAAQVWPIGMTSVGLALGWLLSLTAVWMTRARVPTPQQSGSRSRPPVGNTGAVDTGAVETEAVDTAAADTPLLPASLPPTPTEPTRSATGTPAESAAVAQEAGPAPTATLAGRFETGAGADADIDARLRHESGFRGTVAGGLDTDTVARIARAFATLARRQGTTRIAVGRDNRLSSDRLHDAAVQALRDTGLDVVDIGVVATPVLWYAAHSLEAGAGLMITGGSDSAESNGVKLVLNGAELGDEMLSRICETAKSGAFESGDGRLTQLDFTPDYLHRVLSDVVVAQPLHVVLDGGNGVAGVIAEQVLTRLECTVVALHCDPDGRFPNRHPDLSDPRQLDALRHAVKSTSADLGIALDGDGCRLAVVSGSGRIVQPDRLLMLLAEDVIGRNPGADIAHDALCSRQLASFISDLGGRPIVVAGGTQALPAALRDPGALLAGDYAGHVCFSERWYGFADGIYAAARLLETLAASAAPVDDQLLRYPTLCATPLLSIPTGATPAALLLERIRAEIDGAHVRVDHAAVAPVRIDQADGWGVLCLGPGAYLLQSRFEAESEAALDRLQSLFADAMRRIDPKLALPRPMS